METTLWYEFDLVLWSGNSLVADHSFGIPVSLMNGQSTLKFSSLFHSQVYAIEISQCKTRWMQ